MSDETSSHIILDCEALACKRLRFLATTGYKTAMDRMDVNVVCWISLRTQNCLTANNKLG